MLDLVDMLIRLVSKITFGVEGGTGTGSSISGKIRTLDRVRRPWCPRRFSLFVIDRRWGGGGLSLLGRANVRLEDIHYGNVRICCMLEDLNI